MPVDQRIDYVEFPCNDFDAFEKFYTDTFGWSFTDYGPEYRAFHDGGLDGGIFRSELKSTTSGGAALVIIYAENLEATQEKIVRNGGTISQPIIAFPGGRRFQFFDPHGNELAVWSDK